MKQIYVHLDPRETGTGMTSVGESVVASGMALSPEAVTPVPVPGRAWIGTVARRALQANSVFIATRNFDYLPFRLPRAEQAAILYDLILLDRSSGTPAWIRAKANLLLQRAEVLSRVATISDATAVRMPPGIRRKTRILRPGLHADFWQGSGELELGPAWLYTGGIHPRKRTSLLLEAFAEYRRLGGRADLVTTKRLTSSPPAWLRTVEAPNYTVMASLYEASLGVLYPSAYEGFGLPVLESAAMNRNCITTSAVPAAIEDPVARKAAIVLAPESLTPENLARAILDHEGDRPETTFTEQASRQRWDSLFNWLAYG